MKKRLESSSCSILEWERIRNARKSKQFDIPFAQFQRNEGEKKVEEQEKVKKFIHVNSLFLKFNSIANNFHVELYI